MRGLSYVQTEVWRPPVQLERNRICCYFVDCSLLPTADCRAQFTDYSKTITPHLLSYPDPPSKFMRTLLQRLKPYNLTKPEILMMINLGVGVKKPVDPGQAVEAANNEGAVEGDAQGDEDLLDRVEKHLSSSAEYGGPQGEKEAESDIQLTEGQQEQSDASVLSTIIEEMYERFSDADVAAILRTCEEVLRDGDNPGDEMQVDRADD